MQNSDARVVRGINIAVIVLSVLTFIGFLIGIISIGVFGSFATDPSLYGDGIRSHGYNHGYYDSLSPEGVAGIVGLSLGVATAFLVWGLACAAGTLIAGILGMRNADKVEKLGGAFGWAIAGAVLALLSGRFITMILLIVSAIYINKLRNPVAAPYAQPYAPQGYGQPMPQSPYYGQQPAAYQPAPTTPATQDPAQPQTPAPQAPAPQTPPDQQ